MRQSKSASLQISQANCAVIACDFAESFKCCLQNAPQSAHYGQTPITVFTVALYHRGVSPIVIASDCEKHSKECVLAFIDRLLDELPETVETVNFWTDNATSQFKNQFIMQGMA